MNRIIKMMDLLTEKAKLGSGARFKAVEKNAAEHGASDPAAVAAAAGMKKYGKAKMEKMAHAHENTEVVKEDGLTTVRKTNPGPGGAITTYERDANGVRQTTGSKPFDKAEQRKKYDKYINPKTESAAPIKLRSLVEYDLDDDNVDNENGPGQQLPEASDGGSTSEEAHKLGLKSAGWGYWENSRGDVVAKTIDGQLVKIDRDETPADGVEPDIESGTNAFLDLDNEKNPSDAAVRKVADLITATIAPDYIEKFENERGADEDFEPSEDTQKFRLALALLGKKMLSTDGPIDPVQIKLAIDLAKACKESAESDIEWWKDSQNQSEPPAPRSGPQR